MEILNYRRMDADSRRSAFKNPNLDADFRRLLGEMDPELRDDLTGRGGDAEDDADGGDAHHTHHPKQPRTMFGKFHRGKGREKRRKVPKQPELVPLTALQQNSGQPDENGAGCSSSAARPPLERSSATILCRILSDARVVTGSEPSDHQRRLLAALNAEDLGRVMALAREDRFAVRRAVFEVPDSRGKVFKLPLLHLLVLHHCMNKEDQRTFVSISKILGVLFGYTWRNFSLEAPEEINELAQWEVGPGVFAELSVLHLAAFYGDRDMVRALTRSGADVNQKSTEGETPLLLAMNAEGGVRRSIISHLLDKHADANIDNEDGTTPLHRAISARCSQQLVSLLLESGQADVNAEKRRGLQTPLIQAVAFKDARLSELLLEHGADVFHITPKRQSALHYAVAGNCAELVTLLLEHADMRGMNTLHKSADLDGNTPFLLAASLKNVGIMSILLEKGADLDVQNVLGKTVWDFGFAACSEKEEILDLLVKFHLQRVTMEGRVPVVSLSPLHTATQRDNVKLIKKLLEKGISHFEADSKSMNTFLHKAAAQNKKHVFSEPFPFYDELLQAQNRNLDTPLHMVARHGCANTAEVMMNLAREDLIDDWLHLKNLQKITPFYVAMLRNDQQVARAIADKMRVIKVTEVDLDIAEDIDAHGNTYLHIAARRNFTAICDKLLSLNINVNRRNLRGNTALHEAALEGQDAAVECLLRLNPEGTPATPDDMHQTVADLQVKNNKNRSVLHCAASSQRASRQLLETLVRVISKVDPAGVILNEADDEGNTALHLAIRRGKPNLGELIVALGQCNFELCNNLGDTALHTAAKSAEERVLLATLDAMQKIGANKPLDVANNEGKTVLMLCMENGHTRLIAQLVRSGCNLAYRSRRTGDTALHHLVRLSVQQPHLEDQWRALYYSLVDSCVRWFCGYHEVELPECSSKYYVSYKEVSVKFLTTAVRNHNAEDNVKTLIQHDPGVSGRQVDPLRMEKGEGLTVTELAVAIGASRMMDAIFRTNNVFQRHVWKDGVTCPEYDVTFVTPDTSKFGKAHAPHAPHGVMSCVESLAYMDDESKIIEFLDITPIKQLSHNYWSRYQWIFVLLMVIHIVYMSLFSYFGLQLQLILSRNNTLNTTASPPPLNTTASTPPLNGRTSAAEDGESLRIWPYTPLLLWPLTLFLYLMINFIFRFVRWHRARGLNAVQETVRQERRRIITASQVWDVISSLAMVQRELVAIFGCLFSVAVITWFGLLAAGNTLQLYFLVFAFCLGWLFTIAFTKGFESVNAFSIMLKYIIVIDLIRFFFVFVFIFLGFSLALQALFLHTPTFAEQFSSVWYTLFYVFRMMLAIDDPFGNDEFDDELKSAGISTALPKVTYVVFMIITAIVLLNLLIAMMSDTYSRVTAKERTHWRVSNMRLAIGLEKQLRRIKHWLRFPVKTEFTLCSKTTQIHPKSKYGAEFHIQVTRWYARFPQEMAAPTEDELDRSIEDRLKDHFDAQVGAIADRMSKIESAILKVTKTVDNLNDKVQRIELSQKKE